MCDPITATLAVTAIIGAATATHSSLEARQDQRRAGRQQEDALNAAEAEQTSIEKSQNNSEQVAEAARRRRVQRSQSAQGRQSTILTNPNTTLGADQTTATSTILGG